MIASCSEGKGVETDLQKSEVINAFFSRIAKLMYTLAELIANDQ